MPRFASAGCFPSSGLYLQQSAGHLRAGPALTIMMPVIRECPGGTPVPQGVCWVSADVAWPAAGLSALHCPEEASGPSPLCHPDGPASPGQDSQARCLGPLPGCLARLAPAPNKPEQVDAQTSVT